MAFPTYLYIIDIFREVNIGNWKTNIEQPNSQNVPNGYKLLWKDSANYDLRGNGSLDVAEWQTFY